MATLSGAIPLGAASEANLLVTESTASEECMTMSVEWSKALPLPEADAVLPLGPDLCSPPFSSRRVDGAEGENLVAAALIFLLGLM
jgi:hypothetical protein